MPLLNLSAGATITAFAVACVRVVCFVIDTSHEWLSGSPGISCALRLQDRKRLVLLFYAAAAVSGDVVQPHSK